MRHRAWVAMGFLLVVAALVVAADDPRVGFREEFEKLDGWSFNPKAPCEWKGDGQTATLRDLPGGEVTWGASASKSLGKVNLDKYPYLVIYIAEVSHRFNAKLVKGDDKQVVILGVRERGPVAAHVPEITGWSGEANLSVILYTDGDGSRVTFDKLLFVSELIFVEKPARRLHERENLLPALGMRYGIQPAERLRRDRGFASERTVYRDPLTGVPVWKLTNHSDLDRHDYYDIPAWSGDGSMILWMTAREGGRYRRWLMDANGSNLRPVPTRDGFAIARIYWSNVHPRKLVVSGATTEKRFEIRLLDAVTGEHSVIADLTKLGVERGHEPPSRDDRMFLFRAGAEHKFRLLDTRTMQVREVATSGPIHRLRFTRAPDYSVFFNRAARLGFPHDSWVVNADGTGLKKIFDHSGHPDWAPDGHAMTCYAEGAIYAVNRDGSNPRVVVKHNAGGHGGWSQDGRWIVSDAPGSGLFPHQIFIAEANGSGRVHPVCVHNASYSGWQSGVPDPESTHPAPVSSPDVTKIIYDSDMANKFSDIYVAVCALPERPRELQAASQANAVKLTWKRPAKSRELKGYHVYRSRTSGAKFEQITQAPISTETYMDASPPRPCYYVVTAVEHSGLESVASAEVCSDADWPGHVRHYFEVEDGELSGGAGYRLDGWASNLYLCELPPDKPQAKVTLTVTAPKAGEYAVWVRVREAKGELALDAGASLKASVDSKGWSWAKLTPTVKLPAGKTPFTLRASGGATLDCLLLSTDPDFKVFTLPRTFDEAPDNPKGLRVVETGESSCELAWEPCQSPRFDQYNVYCCQRDQCMRETLVGSPVEPRFVDWGLPANTWGYYRVTAVDRHGNESSPTTHVRVETKGYEVVRKLVQAESLPLASPLATGKDKGALGGAFIHVPRDGGREEKGAVALDFELPEGGQPSVLLRGRGTGEKLGSFAASLDGGKEYVVNLDSRAGWHWKPIGSLAPHTDLRPKLSPGKHRLVVKPRTDGAQLDAIFITNDLTRELYLPAP